MSEADAAAGGITNSRSSSRVTSGAADGGGNNNVVSARQRRKQQQYYSTNGVWEQPQPKIKSSIQRDKAYLRSSGLVTPTSSKTKNMNKIEDDKNNHDITSHFARQLGSADARIRHQTIHQLKLYLQLRSDIKNENSNTGLSEMDCMKLWKCLWYTLYMCDRVPVQEELCQQLCSLIWCVAGTIEQDEYIAQAYLRSTDDTDDGSIDNDDDDDDDDVDDDVEIVADSEDDEMDAEFEDDNEDDGDDDSTEIDFEAKQMALLEEDEDDEEEDTNTDEGDDDDDDDDDDEDEDGDQENDDEDHDEENAINERHCQGAHLASIFLRTFWKTCVREWGKMDKYRIDKFYTCLRYMLSAMYEYMSKRHWSLGIIRLFNDALYEEVLSQVPNGVRYHIIDCCLEELCKASKRGGGMELTEATIIDVLEPFFAIAQNGHGDDTLQTRVVEQVLVKFLNQYSIFNDKYVQHCKNGKSKKINASDTEMLIFEQVHVGTISQFIFEVAADDAVTKDEYRKVLYNVHKQYEKRIREVGPEHDVNINSDNTEDDEEEEEGREISSKIEIDQGIQEETLNLKEDINSTISMNKSNKKVKRSKHTRNEEESRNNKSTEKITAVNKGQKPVQAVLNQIESTISSNALKKVNKKPTRSTQSKSIEKTHENSAEEIIIISKAHQKSAQEALNQTKSTSLPLSTNKSNTKLKTGKQNKNDEHEKVDNSNTKRVQFGDMNRARSYSVSMRGLTKLEVKPILQKSPEKSILLKKRKRAKDYF